MTMTTREYVGFIADKKCKECPNLEKFHDFMTVTEHEVKPRKYDPPLKHKKLNICLPEFEHMDSEEVNSFSCPREKTPYSFRIEIGVNDVKVRRMEKLQ